MGEDRGTAGEYQFGHRSSYILHGTDGYDQEGEDAIRIGVGAERES
jgi:hypothetical protein